MALWSRIKNAFRGDKLLSEIDEEFQSHIAEAVAEGRDPAEAKRAFGNALRQYDGSRDARVIRWLDSLRADAVFGWRQLIKKKTSTVAAVLSLALAIGACTSAFRIVDALMFRPLPVADPDRLYVVSFENIGADGTLARYDSCSYPMFQRSREAVNQQAELIGVSYSNRRDLTYGSDEDTERAHVQYVSGNMFPAFGLNPAAGRLLTPSDDATWGAHPLAVLSYDYWSRRFGRDPNTVGRAFRLGDRSYQIIGIAPKAFTGTEVGVVTDVFLPTAMQDSRTLASATNFWLRTFVKLHPGVNPASVYDRLRATWRLIQNERAAGFTNMSQHSRELFFRETIRLEPAAAGRSNLQRDYGRALTALAALVFLILLIACANVANLMTARAAARGREMALRVSIGAGRLRLVQMVLVESAWLASLSAFFGALFAWRAAPRIISEISPADDPIRLAMFADWRTVLFGLGLAVGVTFLFGLVPALRASRVRPASALKGGEDPHSRRRLMHVLIGLQAAFCFLVLFVAGLFTSTFERLSNQPTGFSSEGLIDLETTTRTPQSAVVWRQVADRLRAVPGVDQVAITGWPFMSGESASGRVSVNGAPFSETQADFVFASSGLMAALKVPLLDGHDFAAGEAGSSVAIVNRTFGMQFFGTPNPTGKWFERAGPNGTRIRIQVIGLIPDVRSRDNLRRFIRPAAWVPFQSPGNMRTLGTFVIKTSLREPLALASELRKTVTDAHSGFHAANIRSQAEINRSNTLRERLLAALAIFFAAVALLLAGVGLYGVLDYAVAQRRREIGIRIAMGARSGDIARGVTSEVLLALVTGAAAGLALGISIGRYVESLLFEVRPADPRMLVLSGAGVVTMALFASLRPLAKAIKTDPARTLRLE